LPGRVWFCRFEDAAKSYRCIIILDPANKRAIAHKGLLSCLVLSCLVLSCLVLPCLALSCFVLSCLVLSRLLLSCLVSSRLVLSGPVLSCLALGLPWACLYMCVCLVSLSSSLAFSLSGLSPRSCCCDFVIFFACREWCEKERAAELVCAKQKRDASRLKSPKGVAVNIFLEIAVADMDDHCVKVYIRHDKSRQDKATQHNTTQHNTTQHNTTQKIKAW
jgi:hypothetical protein